METQQNITGVILAGGRATRMNGHDKGLITLCDKYMIEYTIAALRPQVQTLLISANRNRTLYQELGQCEVFADKVGEFSGPLAGILTGLSYAKTDYVLFVPCDAPLITSQLTQHLYQGLIAQQADISVAKNHDGIQPTFVLLKRYLLGDLQRYLMQGERKTRLWYSHHNVTCVDLSDFPLTFLNINTPEEKAHVEMLMSVKKDE